MQVTAYKDPVTSQLFPTKKAFNDFLVTRKREEAAAAKRRKEQAEAAAKRKLLCRGLKDQASFIKLGLAMYENAIAACKPRRNAKKLEILDITVSDWTFRNRSSRDDGTGVSLAVSTKVTLSAEPEKVLREIFPRLSPADVLHPFRLRGCGGSNRNKDGSFTYSYSLEADLDDLPLLLRAVQAYAAMEKKVEAHLANVQREVKAKQDADSKLRTLRDEVERAQALWDQANEAYAAALHKAKTRETALADQTAEALPFPQEAAAAKLRALTGLPAAGTADYREYTAQSVRTAIARTTKTSD